VLKKKERYFGFAKKKMRKKEWNEDRCNSQLFIFFI